MALSITHSFVSAIPDGADATLVRPSDWNDTHALSGFGTGVETALAVNVGSAGAFVTFNGALGTPSSGTLTNCTGLPVAGGGTGLAVGTSGAVPYFNATTTMASSALLAQYGVITGGGAGAAPYTTTGFTFGGSAAGTGLAVSAGTATTDVQAGSWSQTWNNSAITFTGYKYAITDPAANAGSAAASLHSAWYGGTAGTTSRMVLTKGGQLSLPTTGANAGGVCLGTQADSNSFTMWQHFNASAYFGANYAESIAMDVNGIYVLSNAAYRFSSSTSDAYATQSNISQVSAGLLQVGTTAANSSGRMKMTSTIEVGVAVGSLNAAPTTGEIQSVTDALTPVAGAAVAAGGAAKALVWYNGAQWTVIGV